MSQAKKFFNVWQKDGFTYDYGVDKCFDDQDAALGYLDTKQKIERAKPHWDIPDKWWMTEDAKCREGESYD